MPHKRTLQAGKDASSNVGPSHRRVPADACQIPGGRASLGTRKAEIPDDGESPYRDQEIDTFLIGATTVTNAQFREFVEETGYITETENIGWPFVFWSDVSARIGATEAVVDVEWWRRVDGANWRDINGPGTEVEAWHPEHPVVHVSWNDARAYAAWVGGRLPTEVEWEHAARGGLGDVTFPWGDKTPDDRDFLPCNIWQGQFPKKNTSADGYATTAPAISFKPNGYGLFNMVGNV